MDNIFIPKFLTYNIKKRTEGTNAKKFPNCFLQFVEDMGRIRFFLKYPYDRKSILDILKCPNSPTPPSRLAELVQRCHL